MAPMRKPKHRGRRGTHRTARPRVFHSRVCDYLGGNMKQVTSTIQRQRLPNGLVLVVERMPHARSASIGIWLRAGSRREPPALNGIAHFIEHMVFKGTARRSAEQIAREIDSVGGMLDA